MPLPIRNFKEIFSTFASLPNLKGTYAQDFYRNLKVIDEEHNKPHLLNFSFVVKKDYCNFLGNMHGGAIATLLDCTTTMVVLKADKHLRKTVSADFGLSFLAPANLNDNLIIKNECTKIGKSIAFCEAKIFCQNKLLVSYRHVKAVLKDSYFDEDFLKKMN